MFSVYTTDGHLAMAGPKGVPYTTEKAAAADVDDRNRRAQQMGLKVRYVVKTADVKVAPGD